jgi:ribonuclease Z
MLFDAGEGVLGQLIRKFGIGKLSAVLMSLECVWLSHKHADHVLGILSLIHARPAQAPALIFFGPSAVKRWVFEVSIEILHEVLEILSLTSLFAWVCVCWDGNVC